MSENFQIEGIKFSDEESFWKTLHIKVLDFPIQELQQTIRSYTSQKEFIVVSTSGSTGKPKEIEIPKTAIRQSCLATGEYFNLKEGDTALLCLPLDFIAGKMMVFRAMELGLNLMLSKAEVKSVLKSNLKAVRFCAMVPKQVTDILANKPEFLAQIEVLIIGGAPIHSGLEKDLVLRKINAFETFGMTETVSHIAIRKLGKPRFRVLPGVTIFEKNGTLCIDAPKLSESPIYTNDIVSLDGPKTFRWLGRKDNVINSGGIKIFPEKLEKYFAEELNMEVMITSVPDIILGEKLILIVESALPIELPEELNLNPYEKPKQVICIDQFVRTERGKLNRPETKKRAFSA